MPLQQLHRLRGMDLKSNDINRLPEYAKDIVNMQPDGSGDWVKRDGFEELLSGSSAIDAKMYKTNSKLLVLNAASLQKIDGSTLTTVNFGGQSPSSNWTVNASWGEYNGVMYWTDPAGNIDLYKYDGYMMYRAGLPKAVINSNPGAGSGNYFRFAFSFIDMRGNRLFGDYVQIQSSNLNAVVLDTLNNTEFYTRYAEATSPQTVNSGNLTLNIASPHTYGAGDFIRAQDDTDDKFYALEVSSVTATSITFTSASVGTKSFSYSTGEPIERRMFLTVFSSSNENFGYNEEAQYVVDSVSPTLTIGTAFAHQRIILPMEDIYDTTVVKGLPPRFKYIAFYNNIMVGVNLSNSAEETYSNPEDGLTKEKHSIAWSDPGVGSSVETFGPNDTEPVGKTDEGDLLGVFASSDSMVLLKEEQVYFLNGILTGRLFRIRSALTNRIGCVAHRSVMTFGGGCIFMSSRGLYYVRNGQDPVELSEIIEPFFTQDTTGLNLSTAISILDPKEEKFYVYIESTTSEDNDIVICYDYKYKDWFKFDSISARGGFETIDNVMYYITSGGSVRNSTATKLDLLVAISAKYESGYWNMGIPSLKKKFNNFVLLAMGTDTWTATIKTQANWQTALETNDTLAMSSTVRVENLKLSMAKAFAMSFTIENNVKNETMRISGYEFEYEQAQTVPRGSK